MKIEDFIYKRNVFSSEFCDDIVNIVGEVYNPGSYAIPAINTAPNATSHVYPISPTTV